MKIATFNVNSIRARLAIVIDWLKGHQPDVLCLQETKVPDHLFPQAPLTEMGYHLVFRGEKSYNGVALLSKIRPTKIRFGLDDGQTPDETRLVAAKVGPLYVVNTYVPQGRDIEHAMYQYKLQWLRRLRAWFERHFTPRTPLVWVGDMNVAPEAKDVHNAEKQANNVCYHVAVRQAFADTVAWGYVDIFRKHRPEPGQYSYYDYRTPNAVQRKIGWRVDHFLATSVLAAKSTEAYIDLEPRLAKTPSDHTVMVAKFKL